MLKTHTTTIKKKSWWHAFLLGVLGLLLAKDVSAMSDRLVDESTTQSTLDSLTATSRVQTFSAVLPTVGEGCTSGLEKIGLLFEIKTKDGENPRGSTYKWKKINWLDQEFYSFELANTVAMFSPSRIWFTEMGKLLDLEPRNFKKLFLDCKTGISKCTSSAEIGEPCLM